MARVTVTLAELVDSPLESLLQDVADHGTVVTVVLPSGREILIEPKIGLQSLPTLEGHVPDGWRDAIYSR